MKYRKNLMIPAANLYLKIFQVMVALIFIFMLAGSQPGFHVLAEISSQPAETGLQNDIPPSPTFTCADTVRIMPLGDSITKGRYSGDIGSEYDALRKGYRAHLWWALAAGNYNVEFVGGEQDGWDLVPPIDPDHEGHGGWTAAQIASNIYSWLNSTPADIILLHIGTNGDQSMTHVNAVETILDEIDRWELDNSQHVTVILARIINRQYGGHTATTTFNNNVVNMVNGRAGDDIIIVDLENGAGIDYNTDMVDDKHPNEAGYTKMALGSPPSHNESWYAKLTELLPSCPAYECPLDMISYWPLDETIPGAYADILETNPAACSGAECPTPTTGLLNGGQSFTRAAETKVDVPMDASFNWGKNDSFTIEYWMKGVPGVTCEGNLVEHNEVIVGRQGTGGNNLHFWTGCQAQGVPVGGKAAWQLRDLNNAGDKIIGTSNIVDGEWHHIVAMRDGTSNKNYLYVDGIKEGELSWTYSADFTSPTAPLNFGWLNSGGGYYFTGVLDEVAIYNRVLTEGEILAHYNGRAGAPYCVEVQSPPLITSTPKITTQVGVVYTYQVTASGSAPITYALSSAPDGMTIDPSTGLITWIPNALGNFNITVTAANSVGSDSQSFNLQVQVAPICPIGMVAYWELDETISGTYADTLGVNPAGCSGAACPSPADGILDGGQAFSRAAQTKVNVPRDDIFEWGKDDSFTIEYWMKGVPGTTCNGHTTAHNEVIIGRQGTGGNNLHIWTGCQAEGVAVGGRAAWQLRDINNNGGKIVGTTDIIDGQWHHIVAMRDNSTNKNYLYVDGVKEGEFSWTYTADFTSATAPLNLGWLNSSGGYHFTGTLDEVALYNRVLAEDEITQHYNNRLGKKYCELSPISPAITSTPVVKAQLGIPYTYEVEALGNPQPVFSLDIAPAGMAIDPLTGLITWTPVELGSHDVTVVAANSEGYDSQSFTIMVSPAPACPLDMTAYWKLDETTPGIYADFIGSNDALCTGAECPASGPGILNGGQLFSRALKTKVNVPRNEIFEWGANDSFTIEYWMKGIPGTTCAGTANGDNEVIIGRQGTGSHGSTLHIWTGCQAEGMSENFRPAAFRLMDNNYNGDKIIGTSNIADGQWHHIVAIRDKAANKNYLYVDGVKEGELSFNYPVGFTSATEPLNIGWLNLSGNYHYSGYLDEVALYDRSLTPAEILSHYNNGLARNLCPYPPSDILLSNDVVEEEEPAGTQVGEFSTIDLDPGDTHTYTLVPGDGSDDNAFFVINGNELQTAAELTPGIKTIRVRSTDSFGLYLEKVFEITVGEKEKDTFDVFLPLILH